MTACIDIEPGTSSDLIYTNYSFNGEPRKCHNQKAKKKKKSWILTLLKKILDIIFCPAATFNKKFFNGRNYFCLAATFNVEP